MQLIDVWYLFLDLLPVLVLVPLFVNEVVLPGWDTIAAFLRTRRDVALAEPEGVRAPTDSVAPDVIRYRDVPVPMKPEEEETDVYRLYDAEGTLLYVGIGQHAERWRSHREQKDWWPEVASHRTHRYPYRFQALAVEHAAIKYEKPKYNKARGGLTDRAAPHGWTAPREVHAPLPSPRRSAVAEARAPSTRSTPPAL